MFSLGKREEAGLLAHLLPHVLLDAFETSFVVETYAEDISLIAALIHRIAPGKWKSCTATTKGIPCISSFSQWGCCWLSFLFRTRLRRIGM